MKKLIPMFLAGFVALAGASSSVLANETIENAEFSNVNISLSRWQADEDNEDLFRNWPPFGHHVVTVPFQLDGNLLTVRTANNSEVLPFVSHTDAAKLLSALNSHGETLEASWNIETNTIELVDSWFTNQLRIEDPIDADNINPDEWIHFDFAFGSIMNNFEEGGYSFFGMGGGGSIDVARQRFDPINFSFSEPETLFSTVIGCNNAEVRAIPMLHNLAGDEDDFHNPFDSKLNIQDLRDSNIFTDDEIARILELREIYETPQAMQLSMMFTFFSELITSGVFSDENLTKIIESIELELSN